MGRMDGKSGLSFGNRPRQPASQRLCLLCAGTAFWNSLPSREARWQPARLLAFPKGCACWAQAQLFGRKSPQAVPAPSRRSVMEFQKLCLRPAGIADACREAAWGPSEQLNNDNPVPALSRHSFSPASGQLSASLRWKVLQSCACPQQAQLFCNISASYLLASC